MDGDLEHSPLGASSAERWMNCPGSSVLLNQLNLPQTDEPEYRGLGIAAHNAAEHCLRKTVDTWEIVGEKFHGYEVDAEMANAVQMYLDFVRPLMRDAKTVMIEHRIGEEQRPHPKFYGTVDFASYSTEALDVVDYKHGEGIVVEPDDNAQMKYYAYGILYNRIHAHQVEVRSDRLVRLSIVQPRAYHDEGPIRTWETTAGQIIWWAENELLPAMEAAEIDQSFDAGKWCRFCPAKLFCPLLTGLFGAAAKADPRAIPNFSDKRIGLEYGQRDAVKFYMKAMEDEAFRRVNIGRVVPGAKRVLKQAKRVWKDGAREHFQNKFGESAMGKPELLSPAEMEKVSPAAATEVKEWAYTPNNGYTIALDSDQRHEVKAEKAEDVFAHMIPTEPMETQSE